MKNMKHYKKDGTLFTGTSHKMKDGTLHTNKNHSSTSVRLYHKKELSKEVQTRIK
jgi:hypothetical protein